MKGRILVHGGAGAWKDEVVQEHRAIPALRRAVSANARREQVRARAVPGIPVAYEELVEEHA